MKRKQRQNRLPELVRCANCRRNLTRDYVTFSPRPDSDSPQEKIHGFHDPHTPLYCVMCPTCGHWTINDYALPLATGEHH